MPTDALIGLPYVPTRGSLFCTHCTNIMVIATQKLNRVMNYYGPIYFFVKLQGHTVSLIVTDVYE